MGHFDYNSSLSLWQVGWTNFLQIGRFMLSLDIKFNDDHSKTIGESSCYLQQAFHVWWKGRLTRIKGIIIMTDCVIAENHNGCFDGANKSIYL